LWTSDVQKNPNTVNRYIAGIELTHSFTDKFKILTRANVDGYTDEKISMFPIYSSSNGGGGFATEEGIHIDNIDLMGIGNVDLSENLKLTTLLVNIAEINTVFRGGEYRNFLINTSKFVYGIRY
jgi:hypothetical protein